MNVIKFIFNVVKRLIMPLTALVVILISALQVVGVAYCNTNSWDILFQFPDETKAEILNLAIILYLILIIVYIWLDCKKDCTYKPNSPVLLMVAFTVICLAWLPGVVINYPGSFGTDALRQLEGSYGFTDFMDDNPLHTLLMRFFFNLGDMFGNRGAGAFSYTVFQAVLLAIAFAMICVEIYRMIPGKKISGLIGYMIATSFFALSPMWGGFAQWVSKDIPYTAVISIWMIYLIRVIRDGSELSKHNLIMLVITAIISCLLRINGPYTVLPTMLILVLFKQGSTKKYTFIAFITVVTIYIGMNNLLRIEVDKQAAQRDVTLLGLVQLNQAQQVMRCYVEHPDEITPEEVEIIDSVLEADRINAMYNPTSTDGILYIRRATTYENISKFQQLWLDFLVRFPDSCIQASLNKCYGYYSSASIGYISLFGHEYEPDSRLELDNLYPDSVRYPYMDKFEQISRLPGIRVLSMAGFYTQISIICGWTLLRKLKIKELIPFIPIAINICVCLAGPLSKFIRYALPVAAATPLLIAWVIETLKKSDIEKTSCADSEINN